MPFWSLLRSLDLASKSRCSSRRTVEEDICVCFFFFFFFFFFFWFLTLAAAEFSGLGF